MITDEQLKGLLSNPKQSSRNHYVADCMFCNAPQHFYIKRYTTEIDHRGNNRSFMWDCKKCSRSGGLYKLLARLNKLYLLSGRKVDINKKLSSGLTRIIDNKELDLSVPKSKLPIGFKRLYQDEYLESRGFTKKEFEKYRIGQTNLVYKLDGYIIISVEEDNECKGYIARSKLSKQEIDNINDEFKQQGIKKKYPRYRNDENSFSKIVLGIDEIQFNTTTGVLVEGYFDKVRVDQSMQLDYSHDIKCLTTNGKNVSEFQIYKILQKGIRNIILIQDPDAIQKSRELSMELMDYFDSVQVGFTGEKDLGDSNDKEIYDVFNNLKNPMQFRTDYILKQKLA